ncbi:MAG TPA: pilus assembly protein PilP [Chromatiales bacterium]|nr:pilus assembly protein PilP [Chromatiales bacterium]
MTAERHHKKYSRRHTAGLLLLALALAATGCGTEQHGDLKAYVKKVKARKGGKIEPLPEVKPYDTFVYVDEDRRDPFSPYFENVREEIPIDTGIRPDMNRKREALEEFPLDSLKYVGTLQKKDTLWALVSAPDNTVYRVQVGNHMGSNYGEIIAITETEIKLKEIIPNGATGGWVDREASVSLSE